MSDPTPPPSRSWFERLSQLLFREPQDREQLVELLRDAQQRNILDAHALSMIEGALQVSHLQVRDIMVPRSQMVIIDHDAPPSVFLPLIIESGHSRFPVIGEQHHEIAGLLLAKDLIHYHLTPDTEHFDLHRMLRPIEIVPESKRLDVLLQEFRVKHQHMAIVVDEYGSIAGLVTIEDILEQIVGDIEDEYDVDDDFFIRKHTETQYIVKAITPIEEFNEAFHATLSDEEFDTIGGLVMHAFGHLPQRGESITLNGLQFKVIQADNRRIRLLRVNIKKTLPS